MVWIGFVYKYKMYFWSIWKLFYYMLTKQLQNVPKFVEKIFQANWHFSFGQHQLRESGVNQLRLIDGYKCDIGSWPTCMTSLLVFAA